jgi:hypothetical protein
MQRLQDERKVRNQGALQTSKQTFRGRAFILIVALFTMSLPLTFSTQGLSSENKSIEKSKTVNQTVYSGIQPQALPAEDHFAHIPYFNESEGMSSTLTLNNNMPDLWRWRIC